MFGLKRSAKIVVQETAEGRLTTLVCPRCQVMIHPQTMKCVCCGREFTRQRAPRYWGFLDLLRRTGVAAATDPEKPRPERQQRKDTDPPAHPEARPAARTRAWTPPPGPQHPQEGSGDFIETIFSVLGASRLQAPETSPSLEPGGPERPKRPPR